MEELDRELTDVFPEARDLLYHFLDAQVVLTREQLSVVFESAKLDPHTYEKVLDFLLYYGVLGTRIGDQEYFIYTVNYDPKVLKIRAERGRDGTRYVLNPAFWPALGIDENVLISVTAS